MDFTWEMGVCLALLVAAAFLFVTEKLPADVTSIGIMAALLITGVLSPKEAFAGFSNEAPITVAAMFVLSFGLLKTGGFDQLAKLMANLAGRSERRTLATIFGIAAPASAFINNTPVVAVMMPVVLRHARDHALAASRLLIPLSYAAILGGLCTLIGTSTNLVVHGVMIQQGMPGFTMFELGKIGLPLLLFGSIYVIFFAKRLLPAKETLTTILPPDQRKPRLVQILISRDSPLAGKKLEEIPWLQAGNKAGTQIVEVRRRSARVDEDLSEIRLEELDRVTLSMTKKNWTVAGGDGLHVVIDGVPENELGFETLTSVDGQILEAVISPNSSWVGRSVLSISPRRKLSILVLAIHRNGKNLTRDFANHTLHAGDTLLLLGSNAALEAASRDGDELLLLEPPDHSGELKPKSAKWAGPLVIISLVAVVLSATLNWLPISVASITACLVLIGAKVIDPKEAYRSIDWSILMIICGTMSLGTALSTTGGAAFIAIHSIEILESAFGSAALPWIMLAFFTILTGTFTEFASNNGTAALMAPLAIEVAKETGVNPMAFLVAVTIAASGAFATPIGYQTNTMVYGAGGYAFKDFFRIGLPMNLVTWTLMIILIPIFWPFK